MRWKTPVRVLAAACTMVAAVLLLIGPLLTWATVSADPVTFARALDEDVQVVRPAIEDSTSDFTWFEARTGAGVAEFAGVVVLVLGVVVALRATVVGGIVTVVLGAGAAWFAASHTPAAPPLIDEAISGIVGWAYAAHVHPDVLIPAFSVTRGPSISTVVAGGVLAIVGGLLTVVAVQREDTPTSWVPWTHLTDDDTVAT